VSKRWQQWMPFHIDAFKSSPGVRAMHPAARSGYLYLLAFAWQTEDCAIPSDPVELAEISELGDELWAEHAPKILRKFVKVEATDKLRNQKLFSEWTEAKRVFDARSASAERTNTKRSPHGQRTVTGTQGQEQGQEQRQEAKGLSPLSAQPTIRPEEFANTWNRNRGHLPKVERFTESRRRKVKARLAEGITIERFQEAVRCCRDKPFLRGDNDRGWTADFDWLIENDKNVEKAITKPYGGGDGRQDQKRTESNAGAESGEDGPDLYAALYGPVEQGKLN